MTLWDSRRSRAESANTARKMTRKNVMYMTQLYDWIRFFENIRNVWKGWNEDPTINRVSKNIQEARNSKSGTVDCVDRHFYLRLVSVIFFTHAWLRIWLKILSQTVTNCDIIVCFVTSGFRDKWNLERRVGNGINNWQSLEGFKQHTIQVRFSWMLSKTSTHSSFLGTKLYCFRT